MDLKLCDASSNLDSDVLLPPRKRLLADLKRQGSNSTSNSTESSEFNARMTRIMKEHFDGNPNLSAQDIIESSKTAADVAIKIAEAARSRAQEKAAIAIKAIAAAKKALELVVTIKEEEEEEENTSDSSHEKKELKIKRPKHVSVHLLYKNNNYSEEDEEQIALRLHRNTNKSPTITNRSSNLLFSEKNKHKNPKLMQETDYEKVSDDQASSEKSPSSASKSTTRDDRDGQNRGKKKRGRVKLKRLPLSICSFRDRVNRNEEMMNLDTCID